MKLDILDVMNELSVRLPNCRLVVCDPENTALAICTVQVNSG